MRLKYYSTTIRQMKVNRSFVLFVVMLLTIIIIFTFIYHKNVKPTLKTLSEANAKALALKSSNQAVKNSIQGIKYDDLITVEKDEDGKIRTLSANVSKMNEISNQVVMDTQNEIENSSINYIKIPIGTFFGVTIFGGHGLQVKLNTLPTGICKADFKSVFEKAGINQTMYKITLVITVQVRTIAPFFSDIQEYSNEVAIAETIIVGDTPSTYYDIQGITDLTQKDTLNMTDSH